MSQLGQRTYRNTNKRKQFESFAEDGGHYVYIDTKHQGDKSFCSCGWSGTPFHDGVHLAWVEWRAHVIKSKVIEQADEQQAR